MWHFHPQNRGLDCIKAAVSANLIVIIALLATMIAQ
jgi:hypothetical protein